ncbi:hypothetical protein G4Y79_03765 [Phototrophicus methaneseepsis]|uniref:Uncharacterized protein n=1 Tax=Phototrophicus methaneseepsis TaxID=2710758 RepID=A0A7S8EAR5_9CHLR|nr:hypothetical protein [Phototrophicus methaneseepsis]QPC83511.1 hypothetical protein G4Y79_03765 [Phototrophicus methaneseepsis]
MPQSTIYVRFLLDVPTEEPAYVDMTFSSEQQAQDALSALTASEGQLVSIANATHIPVLIRADRVVTAFPIEYDDDEDDD